MTDLTFPFYAALAALVVLVILLKNTRSRRQPARDDGRRVKPLTPLAFAVWNAHEAALELDRQISLGGPEDIVQAAAKAVIEAGKLIDLLRAGQSQEDISDE